MMNAWMEAWNDPNNKAWLGDHIQNNATPINREKEQNLVGENSSPKEGNTNTKE